MFYYTRLLLLFFWTFATWNLGAASLKEVPFPYSVQRITPESGVTYDGRYKRCDTGFAGLCLDFVR